MTTGKCSLILLCVLAACRDNNSGAQSAAPNSAAHDSVGAAAARADTGLAPADDSSGTPGAGWTAGSTSSRARARGNALLTAVRSAAQPSFERIVFEFADEQMPAWHIEYIDKPVRACGSGAPVELAGDAWLEVRFTGADAHDGSGAPTVRERNRAVGLPVLRELRLTCDFEAEVTWVAGVSTPARYRVTVLKSPARLVVDLAAR